MVMKSTGFMLRTDGKAEVKSDFAEVGKAGKDAFAQVEAAAEQANNKAAKATEDLADRQVAAYRKAANAAKMAATGQANQEAFNGALATPTSQQFATVNLDRSTGAARASAAVFEEAYAAEDRRAASLAKIKALLDPVGVAQARYDGELKTYNDLLARGDLNEREHAQAVAISTARLKDSKDALTDHSEAVMFNRTQQMMLRSAAFNASSSIAAGMPIYRVLIEQGLEVGQALAMGDNSAAGALDKVGAASQASGAAVQAGTATSGAALDALAEKGVAAGKGLVDQNGVGGALSKVMSILTPTRVALGLTSAAVVLGAKAWLDYSNSVAKLNSLSMGSGALIGMDGAQLEASAVAAARAGDITVGAAREITAAYVQTGDISGDVLTGLTALTQDFAAATGQDAAGAAKTLGTAFADPVSGAQMLAEKYGVLSQEQVEHIRHLVEENDLTGAQKYQLELLGPAFAGAADQANILARGWQNIGKAASGAWEWMGRALDRMATGGGIADQIKDLEKKRGSTQASVGQLLMGTTTDSLRAGIDKQIANLRQQMSQEAARGARKDENSARAQGQAIVDQYTGANDLNGYRATVGKLKSALATNQLDPEARRQATETLDAYNHAIDSFIPRQQKANQLSEIDVKIAATKSPARKAELAVERTRIELAGQVITSTDAESQANARGARTRAQAGSTRDRHAESLAREAASMEANARGALDVADAYLKSSAAGVVAEAQRKAATDATRKGISVDDQARRQLNLQVAEGVAAGAKSVAQLREETDARAGVRAQVAAGTLSAADMDQALSNEAALRPLLKLQAVAHGEALEVLTRVIKEYRAELAKSHAEEAAGSAAVATDAIRKRTADTRAAILSLSGTPLEQSIAEARRAAEREADAGRYIGGDRQGFIDAKIDDARAARASDLARYTLDTMRNQQDQLELSQRDLDLVGASDEVRSVELEKLRKEQEIRRLFPEMERANIVAILAGVDAQAGVNAQLKVTAAALDEVRGFGAQFVDTVLSADTWSNWGNAGKTILNELKTEFVKLALLNPLKNMINGNNNLPTITSAIGSIAKLFGPKLPGKNASGNENWSGGLTWVAENGPELLNLPSGTRITSAAETRRVLAGSNDNGGGSVFHFDLRGAVVTQDLLEQMNAMAGAAAVRGAAGGASMASAENMRRGRRSLVGR